MEENNLVNYEGIDLLIKILNKSDKDNKVKKNIENSSKGVRLSG